MAAGHPIGLPMSARTPSAVPTASRQVIRALRGYLAASPHDPEQLQQFASLADALLAQAAAEEQARYGRPDHDTELEILTGAPLEEYLGRCASLLASGQAAPQVLQPLARWLLDNTIPTDPATPQPRTPTGFGSTDIPSVSAPAVLALLRKHAKPGEEPSAVRDHRLLSGGFSKEMIAATALYPWGQEGIVVRKIASGRTATTLADEFCVLSFAASRGVAAPEPLAFDQDMLGSPAFVTRRVPGRCLGDVWGPSEPIEPEAVLAAADALAHLHTLDPSALTATPLPAMTTRAQFSAAVDERQAVLDGLATHEGEPFVDALRLLLAWLRAHLPEDVTRPALVHGDFAFHNILFDGTTVGGIVDWERAHLGDPTEDLAYLRPSVEQVLPWKDFISAYETAGGDPVPDDRLHYFTVWHDVWRAVSSFRLRAKFLRQPTNLSDAVAGLLMCPRFTDRALRSAFDL